MSPSVTVTTTPPENPVRVSTKLHRDPPDPRTRKRPSCLLLRLRRFGPDDSRATPQHPEDSKEVGDNDSVPCQCRGARVGEWEHVQDVFVCPGAGAGGAGPTKGSEV